jgi:tetratricopeptide (TPR) repeat protein
MKKTALSFILILLVFAPGFSAVPQDFPLLNMDIGSKNTAMAGAFTALADDTSAIFVNPAGLAHIKQMTINGIYNKWVLDSSFQYAGMALPLGAGTIAGGFIYSDMGTFSKRNDYGELLLSEIKPYSIGGSAAYGTALNDFLSAGAGIKVLNQSIGDFTATAFMIDFGLIAEYGIFSAGVSLENMEMAPDFFASKLVRTGLAAKVLNLPGHDLVISADVKYTALSRLNFSFGADYTLLKILSVRAGYKFEGENSILEGLSGLDAGLALNIQGIVFEYSFSSSGDLGINHTAGVSYVFENTQEKEDRNYQKLTQFLAYQYFQDGQDLYTTGRYAESLRKFEQAGEMSPDYPGLEEAKTKAMSMSKAGGADSAFEAGMEAYEKGDYALALEKWESVKKANPYYKEIDVWLKDAGEMKANKPRTKEGNKYLSEGLKYYNNCDYSKAIDTWSKGADLGGGKMLQQYIDRANVKKKEMLEGLEKARADTAKETTVVEGIKKLRSMAGMCPSSSDAASALEALKQVIDFKSREYYYKGIDSYTSGNLDAAITYWKGIEDMDPKSDYVAQVNRYIGDARKKQKALEKLKK